jgi:PAS domain S-box-containing protein
MTLPQQELPSLAQRECAGCTVEAALADARVRLSEDLSIWTRVQEISTRLVHNGDLDMLLGDLLDAAVAATGTAGGLIYLVNPETNSLRVVAERGGPLRVVDAFAAFGQTGSALLPLHKRVVVEDLQAGSDVAPDFLTLSLNDAGFRGYQCTPLVGRDGRLLGGLATFARGTHVPSDRDQRILDLLARQAADFTDRRQAHDRLERSERRLRALVDSVADAIVTIDSNGIIQTANPATSRIFGYAPDELLGQGIGLLIPDAVRTTRTTGFSDFINGVSGPAAVGRQLEVAGRRKDGTAVRVELVTSEVEPRRLFTGVMRDVTERRAVEARSRQSDRLASLGTLAAGLGHDMNNVMFPIRAHLNAIASDTRGPGATARKQHIDEIMQGVQYLQQLADGLHYLVNDPGHATEDAEGTSLADWWASTGAILSRSLPPFCKVTAVLSSALPMVHVSSYALTQAVLNLIVNAGEAIAARGEHVAGKVKVSAHAAPGGRTVILSVTDNGIGMPEEVRARALDMFFTTKTRGLGTGLGLAMVSRMAKEAGGSVSIESSPGQGTTVSIHLPVASADDEIIDIPVALTLADGRAAGFIESALRARGIRNVVIDESADADVWIADPRIVTSQEAHRWTAQRAGRTLVLFGGPHRIQAKEWRGLAAATLVQANDFDALLADVDQVCSIIQRRVDHGQRNHDD